MHKHGTLGLVTREVYLMLILIAIGFLVDVDLATIMLLVVNPCRS
jgi:hypothetical protein